MATRFTETQVTDFVGNKIPITNTAGEKGYTNVNGIFDAGSLTTVTEVTASTTATTRTEIPVDSTSGAITITQPSSPSAGDIFAVFDSRGTAFTNNITVSFSDNLNGASQNYIIAQNNQYVTFKYINSTIGWRIIGFINPNITGGVINVKDYGAVGDGVTDDTAAIQAAIDAATTQGTFIYIPKGEYRVSSTINVTCSISGSGFPETNIKTYITDGTPTLDLDVSNELYRISKFRVQGSVASQNTIGIRAGNVDWSVGVIEDHDISRTLFEDLDITRLSKGIEHIGWQCIYENVKVRFCDVGARLSNQNSSSISIEFESNVQDYQISDSAGLFLPVLLQQGIVKESSSYFDNCNSVHIGSLYLEGDNVSFLNEPWITFGLTNECSGVIINGYTSGSTTVPIKLDNVNNITINGRASTGSVHKSIIRTDNAKNVKLNIIETSGFNVSPYSEDNSPALNVFPNPELKYLMGFNDVIQTRSTISEELSTFITGTNALRITATASQSQNYAILRITDSSIIDKIKDKTVTLGARIFVPNLPEYQQPSSGDPTSLVRIQCIDNDGGNFFTSYNFIHNEWNFPIINGTIGTNATQIDIWLHVNTVGPSNNGEYIIVDSIYLCPGIVDFKILEGNIKNDTSTNHWLEGDSQSWRVDSFPTDTEQYAKIGDKIYYSNPSSIGFEGQICTVSGNIGTATFVPFNKLDSSVSEVSTNTTAVIGQELPVDVSSGAITITAPTGTIEGQEFSVFDSRGNAAVNNITINFTDPLHGTVQDYTIDTNAGYAKFKYINSTIGWRVEK